MITSKRIFSVAVAALALCPPSALCQADDLQPAMHRIVKYYESITVEGEEWEADKKVLAAYSQEQLVRTLIAELDVDRGDAMRNRARDIGAHKIFVALDLPPALVCQELDKTDSPPRKASLMFLLRDAKGAQVTQALRRQLDDVREAVQPMGFTEIAKPQALRVCDVAVGTLAHNLHPHGSEISMFSSKADRAAAIEQTRFELEQAGDQ